MCLIIFEEKSEIQDQYPLSLNPVQKADDPRAKTVQERLNSQRILDTFEFCRVF